VLFRDYSVYFWDVPGSHVNVGSVTVTDGDGNTDTATDDATVAYTDVLPVISVTKTASQSSVPETGGNVLFTYTVTNNSSEAVTITALSDDKLGRSQAMPTARWDRACDWSFLLL